jgi:hypothetical protein
LPTWLSPTFIFRLNQVEISNKYYGAAAPTALSKLKVVFWNAERGKSWQVFPDFASDADIVILNEMDWGMARSGNIHTTVHLADRLEMNYAYGVEFVELTNGNAEEINATVGLSNDVGYHGNVVLSKWPFRDSKIIRLHPLYEHLYKHKTKGQDQGERRLGGRMALFAVTTLPDGRDVLVVSVHSHGDAKKQLLQQDAKHICNEINEFRNTSFVLLGGDMSGVLVRDLARICGTLSMKKTNEHSPKGRPKPTCPDYRAPRARFERGDWLVARGGSSFAVRNETVKTTHPFIKTSDGKYECISDHSMIEFTADIVAKK